MSEHFKPSEFRCHCGCGWEVFHPGLENKLEELRAAIGNVPITILSGCRCPYWNKHEGGRPHSQHLRGVAGDLLVAGLPLSKVAYHATRIFAEGGFHAYKKKNFCHVDDRGHRARWK